MTRKQRSVILAASALTACVVLAASFSGERPSAAPLCAAGKKGFIIRAGDYLNVSQMTDALSSEEKDVVDPLGNVKDWRNDVIHVAGLTIPEAEAAVVGALTGSQGMPDLGHPQVRITLLRHGMMKVYVMKNGNTGFEGDLFLPRDARLSDALHAARPQRGANLSQVAVDEPFIPEASANYTAYLAHNSAAGNPVLQNGAVVSIGPCCQAGPP